MASSAQTRTRPRRWATSVLFAALAVVAWAPQAFAASPLDGATVRVPLTQSRQMELSPNCGKPRTFAIVSGTSLQPVTISRSTSGWSAKPVLGDRVNLTLLEGRPVSALLILGFTDGTTAVRLAVSFGDDKSCSPLPANTPVKWDAFGGGKSYEGCGSATVEPMGGVLALSLFACVPTNTELPAVTGSPTVGSTLTVTTGRWTQEPSTFHFRWQRCKGGACVPIPSASTATYVVKRADLGFRIRVAVIAGNASTTITAFTHETARVTVPAASSPTAFRAPPPLDCSGPTTWLPPSLSGGWNNARFKAFRSATAWTSQTLVNLIQDRCVMHAIQSAGDADMIPSGCAGPIAGGLCDLPVAVQADIAIGLLDYARLYHDLWWKQPAQKQWFAVQWQLAQQQAATAVGVGGKRECATRPHSGECTYAKLFSNVFDSDGTYADAGRLLREVVVEGLAKRNWRALVQCTIPPAIGAVAGLPTSLADWQGIALTTLGAAGDSMTAVSEFLSDRARAQLSTVSTLDGIDLVTARLRTAEALRWSGETATVGASIVGTILFVRDELHCIPRH